MQPKYLPFLLLCTGSCWDFEKLTCDQRTTRAGDCKQVCRPETAVKLLCLSLAATGETIYETPGETTLGELDSPECNGTAKQYFKLKPFAILPSDQANTCDGMPYTLNTNARYWTLDGEALKPSSIDG